MDTLQVMKNSAIGRGTKIWKFVNLYSCTIGDDCMIGSFVEIQSGVVIGNRVRVQSHSFICEGVTIEDDVFVGHHVVFINDKYPKAANNNTTKNWKCLPTTIKRGASIGSNATIFPVVIGENAIVGAGAVVTRDVPPGTTVVGNPAHPIHAK